jgi:hypothetical protein
VDALPCYGADVVVHLLVFTLHGQRVYSNVCFVFPMLSNDPSEKICLEQSIPPCLLCAVTEVSIDNSKIFFFHQLFFVSCFQSVSVLACFWRRFVGSGFSPYIARLSCLILCCANAEWAEVSIGWSNFLLLAIQAPC